MLISSRALRPLRDVGKDGKILAIDKTVKPATSAEDMAAKLGELNVPTTR